MSLAAPFIQFVSLCSFAHSFRFVHKVPLTNKRRNHKDEFRSEEAKWVLLALVVNPSVKLVYQPVRNSRP